MAHTKEYLNGNGEEAIKVDPINAFRFENDWNASLFGCAEDMNLCLQSHFCWLCLFCSIMTDLRENCCACCCIPCPLIVFRTKMRSNLRLRGSFWRDSLLTYFMPCCTLFQMKSELRLRGLEHTVKKQQPLPNTQQ